jgi:hypothetical protein
VQPRGRVPFPHQRHVVERLHVELEREHPPALEVTAQQLDAVVGLTRQRDVQVHERLIVP